MGRLKLTALDEDILEKIYRLGRANFRDMRDRGSHAGSLIRPIRSRKLRNHMRSLEAHRLIQIEERTHEKGVPKWHALTSRGRTIAERIVWLREERERLLCLALRDYKDFVWVVDHYHKAKGDPVWILAMLENFLDKQEPSYFQYKEDGEVIAGIQPDPGAVQRFENLKEAVAQLRNAIRPFLSAGSADLN